MKKDPEDHRPRLLALELTRRCRFNCQHCRADADRTADAGEMTTEQWKKILDAIAAYEKCVVILTGGEPTERSDIIELAQYARHLGLRAVMATCGYALNDTLLASLKDAGVLALSFSLDGATAETHDAFRRTPGAFDTVVKAAQATRRAGMRFQINTTITRTNLHEVPAIAELARKLGAAVFNPFILVPTGRGEESIRTLTKRSNGMAAATIEPFNRRSPAATRANPIARGKRRDFRIVTILSARGRTGRRSR